MNYNLEKIDAKEYAGDLVFLYGDEGAERSLPLSRKELDVVKSRRATERHFVMVFDRLPYHLYFVSFNSEKPAAEAQEQLRRSAAEVLGKMKEWRPESAAVTAVGTLPEEVAAFVEGMTLADYSFDRYRNKDVWHLKRLDIDSMFIKPAELEAAQRLWNRIFWCREWVNMPVQDLNAASFADELAAVASDLEGVTCTVMDKRQIESLRMGGLLAVNRGSVDEPRFVVLEYKGSDDKPVALVGKGVMYDTGGLNIKPEDYMTEMKSDMAGAATMASVLFAAADNRLPVHLLVFLPLTDNRPGFNAYAADDILTMYDGTTVEVVNTDAEGRLILADAIAYAVKNYQPRLVIDAATLTGAAVRAIGTFGIAAMQTSADNELSMLKLLGEQVGERIVEFPMWDDYDDLLKSEVADLRNCGTVPQAGAITAGKFLAHFSTTPYVHLDIAGVAFFSKAQHYYGPGASGFGIRLLYAFLQMHDVLNS